MEDDRAGWHRPIRYVRAGQSLSIDGGPRTDWLVHYREAGQEWTGLGVEVDDSG